MAFREGQTIAAALNHVVYYPSTSAKKYPTIVLLHGRGTDELDLMPLVLATGLKNALIVSPRAPRPFELGVGFAWYDIEGDGVPRPETFQPSLDLLRRFISEIKEGYEVDPTRIILLGFSQGAVMSLAIALMDPKACRGVAALSGYIPQKLGLSFDLKQVPPLAAFVCHGAYDPIIPVQLGREASQFLKQAGAHVQYKEYPMGHEVREETVKDLAVWMKNLLQE